MSRLPVNISTVNKTFPGKKISEKIVEKKVDFRGKKSHEAKVAFG